MEGSSLAESGETYKSRSSRSRTPRKHKKQSRSHKKRSKHSKKRSHKHRSRSRRFSKSNSPSSYTRSPLISSRYFGTRDNPHKSNCLGIFGMNIETNERQLTQIFSKYGKLDLVTIIYDKTKQISRGFGFIYFQRTKV